VLINLPNVKDLHTSFSLGEVKASSADNSDAIVKALNTVSVMGFLRPQLSDADTRDLAAYLGAVARASDPAAPLHVWPITFELGKVMVGGASAVQTLHLENRSTQAAEFSSIAVTNPAFGMTHNCPALIAPASRCSVQLSMTAAPSGVQRSALVVSDARGTVTIAGLLSEGAVALVSPIEWEGRASALNFPVQVPIRPPSFFVMTTVAERGRRQSRRPRRSRRCPASGSGTSSGRPRWPW
jgi:hypothetical protein